MNTLKRLVKAIKSILEHLNRNHTFGLAAETAFFLLLGFFPLAMFAVNVLTRLRLESGNQIFGAIFPAEILALMNGKSPEQNSVVLFIGSAWAASNGIWALMRGVYKAYTDKRLSSIKARLLAIAFMLGFVAVIAGTLALLVFDYWIAQFGSLFVIFALLFCLFALIPGLHALPKRAAISAGAGAVGWLVLARAFEVYMRQFSNYTVLYGGIGAFLGLALWLYCLCVLILVCAEWSALRTRKR